MGCAEPGKITNLCTSRCHAAAANGHLKGSYEKYRSAAHGRQPREAKRLPQGRSREPDVALPTAPHRPYPPRAVRTSLAQSASGRASALETAACVRRSRRRISTRRRLYRLRDDPTTASSSSVVVAGRRSTSSTTQAQRSDLAQARRPIADAINSASRSEDHARGGQHIPDLCGTAIVVTNHASMVTCRRATNLSDPRGRLARPMLTP